MHGAERAESKCKRCSRRIYLISSPTFRWVTNPRDENTHWCDMDPLYQGRVHVPSGPLPKEEIVR